MDYELSHLPGKSMRNRIVVQGSLRKYQMFGSVVCRQVYKMGKM